MAEISLFRMGLAMSKKVSVSIVGYNNRHFLFDCLTSLLEQDYPSIEAVYVDNASTDGSADYVKETFPLVKVIENPANFHFAKGHNIGIGNTGGDYVLILNTDVTMRKDFISELVSAMETDDRIGSVSGKIMRADGIRIDTTGLFLGRDRRPLERGYGTLDTGLFEQGGYVFGAGGVSPLYRRKTLESIAVSGEYFDEAFEAYYEDLDLAWRAHRAGWSCWYTPKAVAYHKRGGTNKVRRPRPAFLRGYDFAYLSTEMQARVVKNRYLSIIKNDNWPDFLLNLPFIMLYDIKIWAYIAIFSPGAVPLFFKRLPDFRTAWQRRKKYK